MRFGILGSLEVVDDGGRRVVLGGPKQRSVLAVLLLHANEAVSRDRLVEDLWSGRPPASAATSLQAQVSRLRRALGDVQRIVTTGGGYLLKVAPGELDCERYERLVEEGGAAVSTGDWESAAEKLREALGLWRGPPLSDFQYESFAQAEIARLEELHIGAMEQRIEAELALGREATVIGDLERLVREHPYRERLRGQLMLALYRTGRQADALSAYRKARSVLVEELGIEPSVELRELHEAILAQDPSLLSPGGGVDRAGPDWVRRGEAAPSPLSEKPPAAREDRVRTSPGAPLGEAGSPRRARKVVTALFCDVTGSTALGEQLDPEVWREVLQRYFAEISAIIERHGGTVEKFIGDAVMAVFGIPRMQEDDALRAVRTAAEIRERLPAVAADVGVELRFRTGVNTGPVLMAEGENLAVGDAVNVAARLEQEAQPEEILIGEETFRLVRDAVVVERLERLELKGKAQRVAAYRLVSVDPAAPGLARHLDVPLVGREDELRLLREVWERAERESSCYLFTLLGMAGVGKSRLVAEFLSGISDQATVLRGRCLHYGEGITFWPLVEALTPIRARAEDVLDRISGGSVAATVELFWEVRTLLEALAAERPVVLHIDDLQWAEPTLFDLLDHLGDLSRGAPILLLCTARLELLEDRPAWGGGKLNAITLLLEPLAADECQALLDQLGDGLDSDARERVIAASEGNPLFLEEMAALVRERGIVEVPPTIQALLAARLEGLDMDEREVLECGAIEGEVFHVSAVLAQGDSGSPTEVVRPLASLVRKELIRPHPADVPGEEAFRFSHLLIRDAAYDRVPKARRAMLHARHARWLDQAPVDFAEVDEIAGWHLEQVVRNERELRRVVDAAVSRRAAERLYAAGRRAGDRGDLPAATNLLERALEVGPQGEQVVADVAVELAGRLIELGDLPRADELLTTIERGRGAGVKSALCRLELLVLSQPEVASEAIESQLPAMLEELARVGDDRGIARARMLAFWVNWGANRAVAAAEEVRRAAEHARLAGDAGLRSRALGWYVVTLIYGPHPVAAMAAELDKVEREDAGPYLAAFVDVGRAVVDRLEGRFAAARRLTQRAIDGFAELGMRTEAGSSTQLLARIELAAGDLGAARDALLLGDSALAAVGETYFRCTTQAMLARVYELSGDEDAARGALKMAESLSAPGDAINYAITHEVRAWLALETGEYEAAERWARSAVHHALSTDWLGVQADAQLGLARVLSACGRRDEAAREARAALELFDRKGDRPGCRVARALIDELVALA